MTGVKTRTGQGGALGHLHASWGLCFGEAGHKYPSASQESPEEDVLNLPRSYRHFTRYRQIVAVLVKYGFADLVARLNLVAPKVVRAFRAVPGVERATWGARLRMALEELGPTFVKIGQVLSTRSFLLPAEVAAELALLQDQVKPQALEDLLPILEEELGERFHASLTQFEAQPLASASIAQVHRACTVRGEKVAVKIQRPGIAQLIETDMEILRELAKLLERHLPESRQFEPVALVEELRRTTRRELDFLTEARNVERFARNCEGQSGVHVPQVFWDLTTPRVLTMEYVDGVKISDVDRLRAMGVDPAALVRRGTELVFKQIFEDGFFHADPHPGNILVRADGTLVPVDFGIVGRLDDLTLCALADLLVATSRKDVDTMVRIMRDMGIVPQGVDERSLRADMAEFIELYYGVSLRRLRMKQVMEDALALFTRHRLRIPSNLMLLGKTLGAYEDLAEKLAPDFCVAEAVKPYVKKLIRRRWEPTRVMHEIATSLQDLYRLCTELPREVDLLVRRLSAGRMVAEVRHQGLERLIHSIEQSSNRLSFSLIIAALLVASSLMVRAGFGPSLFGMPAIGVAGYLVAGFLGTWLLVSILRSRRW